MKAHPSQRILALSLALAFALPPAPAHALRQEPPAEAHPATLTGLEENLRPASPPASVNGLEEETLASLAITPERWQDDRYVKEGRHVLAAIPEEWWPDSFPAPLNGLTNILRYLGGNAVSHYLKRFPYAADPQAAVTLTLSRPAAGQPDMGFLNLRYRDNNPNAWEYPMDEAVRSDYGSRKPASVISRGRGLTNAYRFALRGGGQFIIEATDQDGQRKRLAYSKLLRKADLLDPIHMQGTEIMIQLPLAALPGSLRETADGIRAQLARFAGLEEDWVRRIEKAAGRWQASGWLLSGSAFAGPFQKLSYRVKELNSVGGPSALSGSGRLWQRRRQQMTAASLLMEALGAPDKNPAWCSSFTDGHENSAATLHYPMGNRTVLAQLRFRNDPKAPIITIDLSFSGESGPRIDLGQLRIGADELENPKTPVLHIDLADPSEADDPQSWRYATWEHHLDIVRAFTASESKQAALDQFRFFQKRLLLEGILQLPRKAPAAGLEEAPGNHPQAGYLDPGKIADRIAGALLRMSPEDRRKHLDPETGVVTLNPSHVSRLLRGKPNNTVLRRELGDRVNERLASFPKKRSFARRWPEVRGIRIAARRIDTRPWDERRLSRVARRAREKKLSFRPSRIEKGAQPATPLGRELKSAYAQIVRTDNFLQYHRSWAAFLEAHGFSAAEVYGGTGKRARDSFSVFVDLERDERGLPISDPKKHIADLKINRLDSIFQDRRVRRAKTLFLIGVNSWLSEQTGICFGHNGKPHLTSIPMESFRPAAPVKLVLELAVADPHRAVQAARRMDTGEAVYPYDGQVRIFLEPPFAAGQVQKGAFLYRAVTNIRDDLWTEIAQLAPESVYLTHLRTRARMDSDTGVPRPWAHFTVGENLYATSLPFSEGAAPKLTVNVDPATRTPLEAWDMAPVRQVYPTGREPRQGPFRVLVDPKRDTRGLAIPGTALSESDVVDPKWEEVWAGLPLSQAEAVVIQGIGTFTPTHGGWKNFAFQTEHYSTSILVGSDDIALQVEYLANDPAHRPQRVRRMDTGEVVYPAPGQKLILLDPALVDGLASGGRFYKAAYQFGTKTVQAALRDAKQRVAFVNIPTFDDKGRAYFMDPISGLYRRISTPPGRTSSVTAVAHPHGKNRRWAITEAYDPRGKEVFPAGREAIRRSKRTLLRRKEPVPARVRAADRLHRMGALDVPDGVVVEDLQELLFEYQGEVFGEVASGPFSELVVLAGERYPHAPARFWEAAYSPILEAERLPPRRAEQRLKEAIRALNGAAGLEEKQFPQPVEIPRHLADTVHKSYLNRHQAQWRWLRGNALPGLLKLARERGDHRIRVFIGGASRGEELLRAYHEIAAWLEKNAAATGDTRPVEIEINGLELDPETAALGQACLRGDLPAHWDLTYHDTKEIEFAYANAIIRTLNRNLPASRRSLRLVQGDLLNPADTEAFLDADLVIVNVTLMYLQQPNRKLDALREIDRRWPRAYLAFSFEGADLASVAEHHDVAQSGDILQGEYFFGIPRTAAGLEEQEADTRFLEETAGAWAYQRKGPDGAYHSTLAERIRATAAPGQAERLIQAARDMGIPVDAVPRNFAARGAGVLMPMYALRSERNQGMGDIADFEAFIEWAARQGFTWVQTLPLQEGHPGDASPYNARSAFGSDPLKIALDRVPEVRESLEAARKMAEYEPAFAELRRPGRRRDYRQVHAMKLDVLRLAYAHFRDQILPRGESDPRARAFREFQREASWWLKIYSPYRVESDGEEAEFYEYYQWLFAEQWTALRRFAHERNVSILGDIPIYVGTDSDAVRHFPGSFDRTARTGVPPDFYSDTGQFWEQFTYDWAAQERDGFQFWRTRLRRMADLYDGLRVDHFRAMFDYYRIPPAADEAKWRRENLGDLAHTLSAAWGQKLWVADPPVKDRPFPLEIVHDPSLIPAAERVAGRRTWKVTDPSTGKEKGYLCVAGSYTDLKPEDLAEWIHPIMRMLDARWDLGPADRLVQLLLSVLTYDRLAMVVAEDLGLLSWGVHDLRKRSGIPGMRVLGFGLDDLGGLHWDTSGISPNSVTATGLHDTMPIAGDLKDRIEHGKSGSIDRLADKLRQEGFLAPDVLEALEEKAVAADSQWAVFPYQDLFRLDDWYRSNTPNTVGELNWTETLPVTLEQLLANEIPAVQEMNARVDRILGHSRSNRRPAALQPGDEPTVLGMIPSTWHEDGVPAREIRALGEPVQVWVAVAPARDQVQPGTEPRVELVVRNLGEQTEVARPLRFHAALPDGSRLYYAQFPAQEVGTFSLAPRVQDSRGRWHSGAVPGQEPLLVIHPPRAGLEEAGESLPLAFLPDRLAERLEELAGTHPGAPFITLLVWGPGPLSTQIQFTLTHPMPESWPGQIRAMLQEGEETGVSGDPFSPWKVIWKPPVAGRSPASPEPTLFPINPDTGGPTLVVVLRRAIDSGIKTVFDGKGLTLPELQLALDKHLPGKVDYYDGSFRQRDFQSNIDGAPATKPWAGFRKLHELAQRTERTHFDVMVSRGGPGLSPGRTHALIVGRSAAGLEEIPLGSLRLDAKAVQQQDILYEKTLRALAVSLGLPYIPSMASPAQQRSVSAGRFFFAHMALIENHGEHASAPGLPFDFHYSLSPGEDPQGGPLWLLTVRYTDQNPGAWKIAIDTAVRTQDATSKPPGAGGGQGLKFLHREIMRLPEGRLTVEGLDADGQRRRWVYTAGAADPSEESPTRDNGTEITLRFPVSAQDRPLEEAAAEIHARLAQLAGLEERAVFVKDRVIDPARVPEAPRLYSRVEIAAHGTLMGQLQRGFTGLENLTWREIPQDTSEAAALLKSFTADLETWRIAVVDSTLLPQETVSASLPAEHAPVFLMDAATAALFTPAVAAELLDLRLIDPDGLYVLELRKDDLSGDLFLTIYV